MISHSLLGARVYAAAPLPPQRRPRPPLLSRTTSHPASLLQAAAAIVGILREDRGTPLFCRSPSLGAWTRVRWPSEARQLLRSSGLTPSPSHRRPAPFPPHGPPRAALTLPGDLGPVGPAPACDRAPASAGGLCSAHEAEAGAFRVPEVGLPREPKSRRDRAHSTCALRAPFLLRCAEPSLPGTLSSGVPAQRSSSGAWDPRPPARRSQTRTDPAGARRRDVDGPVVGLREAEGRRDPLCRPPRAAGQRRPTSVLKHGRGKAGAGGSATGPATRAWTLTLGGKGGGGDLSPSADDASPAGTHRGAGAPLPPVPASASPV